MHRIVPAILQPQTIILVENLRRRFDNGHVKLSAKVSGGFQTEPPHLSPEPVAGDPVSLDLLEKRRSCRAPEGLLADNWVRGADMADRPIRKTAKKREPRLH